MLEFFFIKNGAYQKSQTSISPVETFSLAISAEPVKTLMFAISLDLYLRYPERIDLDVRRYK